MSNISPIICSTFASYEPKIKSGDIPWQVTVIHRVENMNLQFFRHNVGL